MSPAIWPAAGDGRIEAPSTQVLPKGTITDLSAMDYVFAGNGVYGTLHGDGVTDDYATLLAAYNATAPGAILVIPQPAVAYYLSAALPTHGGQIVIGPGPKGKGGANAFTGPGALNGGASWSLRVESQGSSFLDTNPEPIVLAIGSQVPANHNIGANANDDYIALSIINNSVDRAGIAMQSRASGDAIYIGMGSNSVDPAKLRAGYGLDVQTLYTNGVYPTGPSVILQNPTNRYDSGSTLNGAIIAGATTCVLNDVAGYLVGNQIKLDPKGANPETVTLTGVNAGTKTITFAPATAFAHNNGVPAMILGAPSYPSISVFDSTSGAAGTDNDSIALHTSKLGGAGLVISQHAAQDNSFQGLYMNLGQGSGTWNGKFIALQNNGVTKLQVDTSGALFVSNGLWLGQGGAGTPSIGTAAAAPTYAANKGSIVIRTDAGAAAGSRIYVNQDGNTTWAAIAGV